MKKNRILTGILALTYTLLVALSSTAAETNFLVGTAKVNITPLMLKSNFMIRYMPEV